MNFKEELIQLLTAETGLAKDEVSILLAVPPDPRLGDYAFPCFKLGENAPQEAGKLQEKLKLPPFLRKAEVSGPYLNFFLNQRVLAEETLNAIYKQAKNYGKGKSTGERVVVEYCGPNTNKPLHLGHVRNMALGSSMYKILQFAGNTVSPVNIINDRGVHICQSMLAYMKWGAGKEPDKKSDHFVGDFYVLFSKKAAEDESLNTEVQELLIKWENNDPQTRKIWQKMNEWVLAGHEQTYKRFGAYFEKSYFESKYYEQGKELVFEGLKKGVFTQDAKTGSISAPLKDFNLPDKILLRGDKTSIYITQDMHLATLRYKDFKFDRMLYVVASEQKLHFQQLFKVLELLGKKYAKDMYHLSYGMVHLPSGRMKSREGTVIDADDIMDEVAVLAEKEIKARHQDIDGEEVQRRAKIISLAAIKFFMLQTDPVKDIVFNPEESMSFEGETGPYIQYTHARAHSILRKARTEYQLQVAPHVNFETFNLAEESAVVKKLYEFPEAIVKAAETYKPHHLAQYLIGLSQAFNEFYHKCPVLSEEKNITKARLLLVDSVRQVLENGLNLLGIEAPEKM